MSARLKSPMSARGASRARGAYATSWWA